MFISQPFEPICWKVSIKSRPANFKLINYVTNERIIFCILKQGFSLFHRLLVHNPWSSPSWVYPNKGTRSPTGLRLISDTHDGLPTGLKMACDG